MWCVVGRHSAPEPLPRVADERRDAGWAYESYDVGTTAVRRLDLPEPPAGPRQRYEARRQLDERAER
jgi:hypothetical protein